MGDGLLDRHLDFVHALRGAGLSVSLAEDLDALTALGLVSWSDRERVRETYAATTVKKSSQRGTFDALFDLYFPRMVGDGVDPADPMGDARSVEAEGAPEPGVRDSGAALTEFVDDLEAALVDGDQDQMLALAAEAVARFGAMPGRGPGMSSWSAYTALQRVSPQELVDKIIEGLAETPNAGPTAHRRIGEFTVMVEADARRRIAEERGPDHIAKVALRPSIDRLDFMSARKTDLDELRRQVYPLARRLATRLAKERHAKRRGPLDFRRTVRASVSTGGVPLTTYHRPRRPHRTELVVLCDVSGSVANFAQFTLMLVYALREEFHKVRAFTFIDHVVEVTDAFKPGADMADVMSDLAASTAHAALWGRTNYGRAFTKFNELYPDALGPKSSLLILGDARSNYVDLAEAQLRTMTDAARHAYWLNPEHPRHWGSGDSAAPTYGEIIAMHECRNLQQLSGFVHDLV